MAVRAQFAPGSLTVRTELGLVRAKLMAEILQVNWRYAVPRSGRDRTSQEDQEKEKAKYKLRGPSVRKRLEAEYRLGRARGPRPRTPSSKMSKKKS